MLPQACKQTGEKFFDSQFAPSPESLFAHYEPRFKLTESDSLYSENGSVGVQETGTRWCRASEMSVPVNSFSSLFSSWELMHPHIQASDVKQGGLGSVLSLELHRASPSLLVLASPLTTVLSVLCLQHLLLRGERVRPV